MKLLVVSIFALLTSVVHGRMAGGNMLTKKDVGSSGQSMAEGGGNG